MHGLYFATHCSGTEAVRAAAGETAVRGEAKSRADKESNGTHSRETMSEAAREQGG